MKQTLKKSLSVFLALTMVVSLLSGVTVTANATVNENDYKTGAVRTHHTEAVSQNNTTLQLLEGDDYVITVAEGVTALTVVGCGAAWDAAGTMTSTANEVLIDCSAAPGITLTLKNVYFSNNFNKANTVNFSGTGNTLIFDGACVIDTDNNAYGYAAIHVNTSTALTLYGTTGSSLYFYKQEQGAGVGGNAGELNGNITFGLPNGKNDFYMFMKGTKQGALIGAGSNSSNAAGTPGAVTFNCGVYNLETNSRGACIGGSAGGTASAGTDVYVNGASLNINIDYSGAAIGGGGYDGGSDSTGGNLYVTAGSVRTVIDYNAALNTTGYNGKTYTAGVNDAAIHTARYNSDGTPVYWCIVNTDQVAGVDADSVTVQVDGNDFYSGPLHNYSYIQETLDKANQYTITSTPSNWVSNDEPCLYLFLTGEDHTVTVNGKELDYVFNSEDGTFTIKGGQEAYAVSFGGMTQDMSVTVYNADGTTAATGSNCYLTDGNYTYTVSNSSSGDTLTTGSFTVDGARKNIDVRFNIKFSVTPADAAIEVGGSEGTTGYVAKAPNADGSYSLQAGSGYTLKLTSTRYASLETTFDVTGDATLTYTMTPATCTGVSVTAAPTKLTYTEGETFDPSGLSVTAAWDNGDTESVTDYTVSLTGALTASDTSVTVSGTFQGKAYTATWPITVNHNYENGYCTVCGAVDRTATALTVSTAAQLKAIADAANDGFNFSGVTVTLAGDIDLQGSAENVWAPIGGASVKHELTIASQADLDAAINTYITIYDSNGKTFIRNSDKNGEYGAGVTYWYLTGAPFAGTFNGAGHTISGLYVSQSTGYAGLFGNVSGTVEDLTVNGSVTVAAAADTDYIGGIAGKVSAGGTITRCVNNAAVNAGSVHTYNVGGIAGMVGEPQTFVSDANPMATVSDCVNNGAVTGYVRVGGIAGRSAGTVTRCANHGTVFNGSGLKKGTGGIVGMNGVNNTATDAGIISDCYNDGYVNGNKGYWTGGICGFQNAKSSSVNCYNAGTLYTSATAAGSKYSWVNSIVGQNEGTVTNCYWLNKDSGDNTKNYVGRDTTGVGNASGTVTNVVAMTETEMKAAAFVATLGASFKASCSSFPILTVETATDHVFTAPTFQWTGHDSCTATFTCTRCGETIAVVPCTISTVTTAATCTVAGSNVYTADAVYNGVTYTDAVTETIPAGHTYGEPVFTWNGDAACTAEFTCAAGDDTRTVDCTVALQGSTAATCTAAGEKTCTASVTFEGTVYTDTKTFVIPATGHTYGEPVFTWNGTSCLAVFTCTAGDDTVSSVCRVTSRITVQPTCTTEGSTVYTATVTLGSKNYTDSKTVVTPANGHTLIAAPAKAPTSTTNGNTAYWTCTVCGKYFSDADGKNEITLASTVIPAYGQAAEQKFRDVISGAWYADGVNAMYAKGCMNGMSGSEFGVNTTLTRAMLVTVLYRMAGSPAAAGVSVFSDVTDTSAYYYDAVLWASSNGIVKGYDNGTFQPGGAVTRQEMAAFLYRYAVSMGYDVTAAADLSNYADADKIASWALPAMKWANAEGLIQGRSTTRLVPDGTATRGEVATILMRFCQNIVK